MEMKIQKKHSENRKNIRSKPKPINNYVAGNWPKHSSCMKMWVLFVCFAICSITSRLGMHCARANESEKERHTLCDIIIC